MKVEWSADALADLNRFAAFLHQHHPTLAKVVAAEIIAKVKLLEEQPLLGAPIAGREEYRQIVLRVLNAAYVFQYRISRDRMYCCVFSMDASRGNEGRPLTFAAEVDPMFDV